MIVVAPTFDTGIEPFDDSVAAFRDEVIEDLRPGRDDIPDLRRSATPRALGASGHRAFGGFSLGGVTTWHMLGRAVDYFEGFLSMSGDSWTAGIFAAGPSPGEPPVPSRPRSGEPNTAPGDFTLYAATGAADIAYEPMRRQIAAMRRHPEVFRRDFRPAGASRAAAWITSGPRFPTACCRPSTSSRWVGPISSRTGTIAWRSPANEARSSFDAEVTRLETEYEIGPEVDVAELLHSEQHRKFMLKMGLSRSRPQAVIEFHVRGGLPAARGDRQGSWVRSRSAERCGAS